MSDAAIVVPIVLVVLLLIVILFLRSTIYIVSQAEGIVVERFGRFNRILTAGVNFVWPIAESVRRFTWRKTYIDETGRVRDETTTEYRVDLRESVYNFVRQDVYTRDTVLLEVNAVMYYSISDTRKAIYEVDDLDSAIQNTAQSQLKEIFGMMHFKEALASQVLINNHMRKSFAAGFERWGLTVHRVELLDLSPKGSSDTSKYMKKEVIAERTRRADFIEAEGNKAAMRLTSEGTKAVRYNLGVAEQEATRKRSEGTAAARIALARAEKVSFSLLADTLEADGCSQSDYLITQSFFDLFKDISSTVDVKQIFLPFDLASISGLTKNLASVYGRSAIPPAMTVAASGSSSRPTPTTETFDELN
jgi:regulator of protease activity HflC (stomatin/prohibitin superfamily)